MNNTLLHTPEGVRDIYGKECAGRLAVQEKIHRILHLYGYEDIQTPTFEFFDIFTKERGTVDTKDMYKFFDRDGNTLVLRPDITPSIARSCAKYFAGEQMPIRLCYIGNTFINNRSYQGRLKELTQIGAELLGADSAAADAEMIAMVIDALLESGLTEFQIDIGQVEFFKGLVEEAKLSPEIEADLRSMIENKNHLGVEAIVQPLPITEGLKDVFVKLPSLFGILDTVAFAKSLTTNRRATDAIHRLEQIYEILGYYGFQKYITFDLGMLNEYSYYTGIIFKGYTYGRGEPLLTGGRYDKLVKQFGKDTEAIGFVVILDELIQALSRQNIQIPLEERDTIVLYRQEHMKEAVGLANTLRNAKVNTVLMKMHDNQRLEDFIQYGEKRQWGGILYLDSNTKLKSIDIAAKTQRDLEIKDVV